MPFSEILSGDCLKLPGAWRDQSKVLNVDFCLSFEFTSISLVLFSSIMECI